MKDVFCLQHLSTPQTGSFLMCVSITLGHLENGRVLSSRWFLWSVRWWSIGFLCPTSCSTQENSFTVRQISFISSHFIWSKRDLHQWLNGCVLHLQTTFTMSAHQIQSLAPIVLIEVSRPKILCSKYRLHSCYDFHTNMWLYWVLNGFHVSLAVVCPYPGLDPDRNSSVFLLSVSDNSTGHAVFDRWWSKTDTVPFYLIALLLPLLNFRSASFFARFTFLGKSFCSL